MIRVFEAFSGMGAQVAALRNIGIPYQSVGISEIDKNAIKAYNAIHGETKNFGDITKIDPATLPDFDLFTYSFPCTDISNIGLQKGLMGTRSGLLYECKKIIEAKRPKYLLLENVKPLVSKKFKGDFDAWVAYLDTLGYNTYWKVLNAKDFGHAQNRERVFAVSILKEYDTGFTFNVPNVRANFGSIKEIDAPYESLYNIAPFMHKAIALKKNKILSDDGVSCCLTTKQQRWNNGGMVQDVKGLRYLTPLECVRLMGFSDSDYEKIKDMRISEIYFITGNSICVKVLESIFKSLFKTA
jgi:DNA (cytosine-5)-methyltransferase 1